LVEIANEKLSKSNKKTIEEYVRGIDYCIDNARRLIIDAKFLDKADRFPSAIGLATFAHEELGKAMMLIQDLLHGKRIRKKNWRPGGKFTRHLTKMCAPSRYRSVLGAQAGVHDEMKVIQEMSKLFVEGRLRCFYVDWSPSPAVSGWSSPTNPGYVGDLRLLVGEALPLAQGWLEVIEPYWRHTKQLFIERGRT
jgi:AbiV family abortive infection protein